MLSKRKYLFGTTVLAGVLTLAAPVVAQTAPDQDGEATEVEEIIVTGSLIRRTAESAPTPLIQASRETILESGEVNLVDFLADIPALQNSQVPEDTTGGFVNIGGLSFLNLRNLGAQRTLVLVDGRRHVGSGGGQATVDVDTIPTPLVERVEIITGASSALYGADAVSGVVNFIMRTDFEGLEIDAAVSQLTQNENALAQRISVVYGKNLFDDRLNIYGYGEYQTTDPVFDKDLDIDWLRDGTRFITVDADPGATPVDGILDNDVRSGLLSLNRPVGGVLTLANGTRPSVASDPDVPFITCPAPSPTNPFSSNCFASNPGVTYQFRADGTPFLADFGSGQPQAGVLNRTITIGGSGDSLVAVETNRLPEQENYRFQTGVNFDINDNVSAFAELKYVNEENIDVFQPHFANVNIRAFGPTEGPIIDSAGLVTHTIGLDNAYMPTAVRNAILANQRIVYDANGNQVGAPVADPRAQMRLFSYDLGYRPAIAEREVTRFVGGFRGEFDSFFALKDGSWEIGYTYGKYESLNTEPETIDVSRYVYSIDAVVDTNGEVNGRRGEIVCRVQLLARRGTPVINAATGTAYAANDPTITGCVPSNVFGTGGLTNARNYILTSLETEDTNEQKDVRAFVSGNLWDFWGAGPIGIAFGAEYREETTSSDLTEFGNRILFGNAAGDLAEVGFDVAEGFIELRIPLLTDMPFAEELEISGAFRYSDYSTSGETETYSLSALWRPIQDIAFRGTYGESVRAPTLNELFSPPGQTFPNLNDNCSSLIIAATADARIRANRTANCAALGIPTTYIDPNPGFSNSGFSGSNPGLQSETSVSHTISTIITPRFAPGFSLVVDYYDIEIEDAIATLTAQTLLNLCTDEAAVDPQACGVFTRAPATAPNAFEIISFIEGPFNFAALRARGVDFQARYSFETEDLFGRDYGRLSFGASGNYLIRRQNFTNPTNPFIATDIDKGVNSPRVRLRGNVTWSQGPLAVTWRTDVQTSQILLDRRQTLANFDTRSRSRYETGSFVQHDLSANWEVNEDIVVRAGVNNIFDAAPNVETGLADNFDLFGRRYFAGITLKY